MRLLVFGLGYSARAAVERLRPRIEAAWGTTREAAKLAEIAGLGVTPLLFDGRDAAEPSPRDNTCAAVLDAIAQATHILISIPPDERGDPALRRFGPALAAGNPRTFVYLSTVGVYGDHGGDWVDETSACRPLSARSIQRLAAESAWRDFGAASGAPVAVLRLAGIYGPGRGPFEKLRRGTARRVVKPGQVFNRIHVDDIAAVVDAAFASNADGVFNGSDDEPAPPEEVIAHAAALLGLPPPPEVAFEAAEMTPMARSFYGENKRVRNDKIKQTLDVRLAWPTYREGLAATLEAERGPS